MVRRNLFNRTIQKIMTGAEAAILAAISAASTGAQIGATSTMNRKTREWSEKMYGRQWADNIRQWHEQNKYNSPVQQMARLKEAGISPHTFYAKGGGSPPASPLTSPGVERPNFDVPDYKAIGQDVATNVDRYYNLNQVKEQTANIGQQTKTSRANELNMLAETRQKLFNLAMDKSTSGSEIKRRQSVADKAASEASLSSMDKIMRSTLYKQEVEAKSEQYQQQISSSILNNWKNISELDVHQASPQLYQAFIRSGMSQGVAMAALTQAKADLAQQEAKYFTPQLVLGAVQKVVGMIPGVRGLFRKR